MTSSAPFRPVLAVALAATLSACGVNERDPHRFEGLARTVADIPLSNDAPEAPPSAKQAGLRPLQVELLTPHQLWDARDGVVGAARAVAPALPDFRDPEAPAATPSPTKAPSPSPSRTIQLGAYASEASARSAWRRMQATPGAALADLSPVFEPVRVGERTLVRLKVSAESAQAAALCARLAAADPWCAASTAGRASTGST